TFGRRRHWRMMGGMLITLGGVTPTVVTLFGALTAGNWVWWVGLAVTMVLMTCSTILASLNNDNVRRSALELATWVLIVAFAAGAVGVALGIVAVVSVRTWWVAAVPLSAATGASLVGWLATSTVHSLSHAPTAGVDLLTRAQKEDVGRLMALSGYGWILRTRLMLLAVAVGWVLPLPGVLMVYPWSDTTIGSAGVLVGVIVFLGLGGFAAVAASRINPSTEWAIAQTKMLVTLALVATGGALVVGGPVAWSYGAQLAASLVISCALLAGMGTFILVRQIATMSWSLWRARTGLLGDDVAAWVAEADEAGRCQLAPGVGVVPGCLPRGSLLAQARRLLWPVRSKEVHADPC
ncbi:MAG: hypothetical protein FWD11_10525, partial [Micrococcales bacterium]|nr:hypothetical protein [Micrococcales bacterium]